MKALQPTDWQSLAILAMTLLTMGLFAETETPWYLWPVAPVIWYLGAVVYNLLEEERS